MPEVRNGRKKRDDEIRIGGRLDKNFDPTFVHRERKIEGKSLARAEVAWLSQSICSKQRTASPRTRPPSPMSFDPTTVSTSFCIDFSSSNERNGIPTQPSKVSRLVKDNNLLLGLVGRLDSSSEEDQSRNNISSML